MAMRPDFWSLLEKQMGDTAPTVVRAPTGEVLVEYKPGDRVVCRCLGAGTVVTPTTFFLGVQHVPYELGGHVPVRFDDTSAFADPSRPYAHCPQSTIRHEFESSKDGAR